MRRLFLTLLILPGTLLAQSSRVQMAPWTLNSTPATGGGFTDPTSYTPLLMWTKSQSTPYSAYTNFSFVNCGQADPIAVRADFSGNTNWLRNGGLSANSCPLVTSGGGITHFMTEGGGTTSLVITNFQTGPLNPPWTLNFSVYNNGGGNEGLFSTNDFISPSTCYLYLDGSNKLRIQFGGGEQISASTFASGIWQEVTVKMDTAASGTFTILTNNVVFFTGTGIGVNTMQGIRVLNRASNNLGLAGGFADDWVLHGRILNSTENGNVVTYNRTQMGY